MEIMMSLLEIRTLTAFGRLAQGSARRDLRLLRAIQSTLDALDIVERHLYQMNQDAEQFIQKLRVSAPPKSDDMDMVNLFENARDSVGRMHEIFCAKHLAAVSDPALTDEDGVVESYARLSTEAAILHDRLNTLAWLIGEHEADQEHPLSGSYANAEDLFAALGV